jgi:hypothetical protein
MQTSQKLACIALGCMILLSGVVLLIDVMAQMPQRAQIVFETNRDGNYEIYVMDADGKNQRRLTDNPANDWCPDWFDPAFAYAVSPAGKLKGTWGWLKQNSE